MTSPMDPITVCAPAAGPRDDVGTDDPRDREFHRLGRGASGRGWRPLLTALLAAAIYAAMGAVLLVAMVVAELATGEGVTERIWSLDLSDPYAFVGAFGAIALMLPAVLLARLVVGPRPVGLLVSVLGRMRWRWLGRAMLISGTVYVVGLTVGLLVVDPLSGVPLPPFGLVASASVLLIGAVLLVPFQAAAEEYVFRGALMQLVGGWLRHPVFAILIPVPLFVIGHGYDPLGQTGIAVFALMTGWITWRTGGLEAAIALHVVNNSLLTVMAAVGWADPNATVVTLPALVLSVLVQAAASWWLVRTAERLGVERLQPATTPAVAVSLPAIG